MATLTPNVTKNVTIITSQSLAAGNSINGDFDWSLKFGGTLHIKADFGAAPDGTLAWWIYKNVETVPDYAVQPWQMGALSQATDPNGIAVDLPPGDYRITLKNNNSSVAVTVEVMAATVDSYSYA